MKYLKDIQISIKSQPTRIQGNFFNPSKGIFTEPIFKFNGKISDVLFLRQRAKENANFSTSVHSVEILENAIWQGKETQGKVLRAQRWQTWLCLLLTQTHLNQGAAKELLSH